MLTSDERGCEERGSLMRAIVPPGERRGGRKRLLVVLRLGRQETSYESCFTILMLYLSHVKSKQKQATLSRAHVAIHV